MASSRDRQRKLARAKYERQQARRADRERRRRRIYAGVGTTAAVLLVVAGGAWIGGAFDSDNPVDTAAIDTCLWTPRGVAGNPALKEAGTPPTKDIPQSGVEAMTITTDKGEPIVVSLDVASSPCAAASFSYLAGKNFFDNTECHELTTEGALRCGDPSGTGQGGPTYSYYDENQPAKPVQPSPSASTAPTVVYPKGTVALLGDPKGVNGSQFLIFHQDFAPADPQYSIIGQVTGGLDTLAAIAKIPTVENEAGDKIKPKDKITIKTLTVGTAAASAAPSAAAASAAPANGAQS
ncbi:peptidylprolyl isomerase [Actinoplanes sp. NEAU-A12]|uniref:Peptidylprolyl isomerase n=1 Tax=Actinoplanes sandaracinus TaxID=3045177 RepID=A0ABT6WNV7_9ACTN|nr:peptidylprolyl isomerase [Actinoplanes sandaracinus]MDI6101424.1 peptidylprolyl isomerase [Actinoplanes sandaracinus]